MIQNQFTVEQKTFLGLLSSMQPICTKRTTLEATSSILFQIGHKELVLKATDLEISLQASYPLKSAHIETPQAFLVSGRRLFELVKELDGDIVLTVAENQLQLRAASARLSLNIKDVEEFPPFPERIENLMELDVPLVLEMLAKVAFLIPQNNANPSLNGLFLEISDTEFKMTTTDGHCLAQVSSPAYTLNSQQRWLLPRRAVFEVKKILEGLPDSKLFLGMCDNQLVFSGESFNFFTRLLNDSFPQYATILKRDQFLPAKVDRAGLIKTLRRSACLLSGQFIATKFDFEPRNLKISMLNKEVGALEEEMPLESFEGSKLDVRFYAPYLLSGLQVFSDKNVEFFLHSSSKPVIFEAAHDQYRLVYLVMPIAPTHGQ